MKISTRARYGLRLMVELASRYGKGPIYLKDIANSQDISEKYLSQLVIPLKSKGLLSAYRGASGGYVLSKDPSAIKLLDIIEALEGEINVVECVKNKDSCEKSSDCVTHEIWSGLNQTIIGYFESFKLSDLMRMRAQRRDENMSYTI